MTIKDRLPVIVEVRSENRDTARKNAADREKDKSGRCSSMLSLDLRFFGAADFVLKHDIESFRQQLSEAAKIRKNMYERASIGEPIDESYLTMLSFTSIFDALAAGDLDTAKSLALHVGGREELERAHDHPFDYAMGYTLRAFMLNDGTQMQSRLASLVDVCVTSHMRDFEGYCEVFSAVLESDGAKANKGLRAIVAGHQRQSKGKGVFAGTEDEVICIWGIGIANLCRMYGLIIEGVPPLIPDDLII
jgi:hypothetical protein